MSDQSSRQRPLVAVFDLVTSVGGVQSVMAAVLPKLNDEFDIKVMDPYNHPEYATMMRDAGLTMASLGGAPERRFIGGSTRVGRIFRITARLPWLMLTMQRLRRWITVHKPDFLYFNQLPVVRIFSRAATPHNPKLVYHAHGFRGPGSIGEKTGRLLARRFARVFAVSKITRDFLIEAGADPETVKVVYNAVDVDRLHQQVEAGGPPLPKRNPDDIVFVHAAVLDRRNKAQHLAIDALARLPEESQTQLWICGDVPPGGDKVYLQFLRERVRSLGLQERVHFLGWRTDIARVLQNSDVCLLPSLLESFGMVLAEAMALAKPCIGSNRGGIPEVIQHNETGIVCPPTVEDLASAMARLAGWPDIRASMGRAGLQRVAEMFNIDRQADQIAGHLRAILGAERNET